MQENKEGDVSYPKIVSTNKEVEAINFERLSQLPGEELIFRAEDLSVRLMMSSSAIRCAVG